MSTDVPLLEVRGLRKWYDIRSGIIPRVTGHVRAVDAACRRVIAEARDRAGAAPRGGSFVRRRTLRPVRSIT